MLHGRALELDRLARLLEDADAGRAGALVAHLRAALATYDELGAEPLAVRARAELRASGETPRKRDPSTLAALTPMEAQVARLVVQGLSNEDVATQLWIYRARWRSTCEESSPSSA